MLPNKSVIQSRRCDHINKLVNNFGHTPEQAKTHVAGMSDTYYYTDEEVKVPDGLQELVNDIQESNRIKLMTTTEAPDKYNMHDRRLKYARSLVRKLNTTPEAAKLTTDEIPDYRLLANIEIKELKYEVFSGELKTPLKFLDETEFRDRRVKYLQKLLKNGNMTIPGCKAAALGEPEEFFLTGKERKELKSKLAKTMPMSDVIRAQIEKILSLQESLNRTLENAEAPF